jgi:DtxR family Mn-dependent transcriptional regulator
VAAPNIRRRQRRPRRDAAADAGRLWRAFEANEITHSGAHYLLAVAALTKRGLAPRAADVARQLGVTRAAASLQLHSLQEHGLVASDERQRLSLSPAGADLVGRVASKREVLLVLLRDVLGVREITAQLDACKVEHLLSEESGAALVRLIRYLRSDVPEARACLKSFRRITATCPPGARCDLCAEACLLAAASPP